MKNIKYYFVKQLNLKFIKIPFKINLIRLKMYNFFTKIKQLWRVISKAAFIFNMLSMHYYTNR